MMRTRPGRGTTSESPRNLLACYFGIVIRKGIDMTTIAGVNSYSRLELIQRLQQLTRNQSTATGQVASTTSSPSGESRRAELESFFENALVAAGLDSSKVDEVKTAISSAVSSALSTSDGTTDPRQVVGQAVAQTLQEYGVDTDALKEQMKSQMGSMRPPGPPPGAQGNGDKAGFDSKLTDALTAAGVDSSELDQINEEITSTIASLTGDSNEKQDPESVKSAVHTILDKYGIDTDAFDKEMESGKGSMPPPGPPPGGQDVGGATTGTSSRSGSRTTWQNSSSGSSDSYQWLAGLFQIIDTQA
jgi:hypothetical protein